MKNILDSYYSSDYSSIKYDSYFLAYQKLLERYIGCDVTIVEIGVFNGGSLFMWRDFLGNKARVIGIDLNPGAKYFEKYGFEIYIGSQSDPLFWQSFFDKVGKVDLIIDDGGHSNLQQVVTLKSCIENINDGGMLICEDVHTSYFTEFGNPSRFSFVNFSKGVIDSINSRSHALRNSNDSFAGMVFSIEYFESIIAFKVNRSNSFKSSPKDNQGKKIDAKDFRYSTKTRNFLFSTKNNVSTFSMPLLLKKIVLRFIDNVLYLISYFEGIKNFPFWRK